MNIADKIYYRILIRIRKYTRENKNSFIFAFIHFIKWHRIILILAISGLYLIPLIALEKGLVNHGSPIGKLLYGYFELLKSTFGEWCLGVHCCFCIAIVSIINVASFIRSVLVAERRKSA